MRAYLGFIPFTVVSVPFIIAAIRQALYYRGCMDGYGYILISMGAFMVGGILNIIYLFFVAGTHRTYFAFESRFQRIAAKCGFIVALLLFVIQTIVMASIGFKQLTVN
ncbi:MAG: hypothetical protein HQK66_07915 [Desulfamplus sp.]|nr:hypothetical protein [Desulfamplus sp.]